MKATVAWWNLDASTQTIESLREYLKGGGVEPWTEVDGLKIKFWVADPVGNRWGAVMLWERSPDETGVELPPHRAAELIGYGPTERIRFDVEAMVEGKASDYFR